MLLDAIIQPISDLSTLAAQSCVEYIADRSSLRRDGWSLMAVRVLIACAVFLVVAVGVPALLVGFIWWFGLKALFP